MPFDLHPADPTDHLRRHLLSRWIVLGCMATLVVLAPAVLDIDLPQATLLGIIGVTAALNALLVRQNGREPSGQPADLTRQLLIDIAMLSALLFFTGGATNPLVSLLLPPVAIAALSLPARHVLLVGTSAVIAYSLLMLFYLPLPIADASRATHLHLIGMWLTFTVSAALIGWIILRVTQMIRRRDAELAEAREQALRDERVTAMGTLAAGAAHELGTPLATMALVVGELAHDPQLSPENRADIALLRQQIGICKDIISGMTRRAGAERLDNAPRAAIDHWLGTLREHWQAVRPQANSQIILAGAGTVPQIVADPRLEQAVLNLLDNAANASPLAVEISVRWTTQQIQIDIRDQGPGFPETVLAHAGQEVFPAHAHGHGVGLLLTRSAIEQLGGRLILLNPDDGGALARIELPRIEGHGIDA